jgi:hypothetical protein
MPATITRKLHAGYGCFGLSRAAPVNVRFRPIADVPPLEQSPYDRGIA